MISPVIEHTHDELWNLDAAPESFTEATKLRDLDPETIWRTSQGALVRLLIFFTGQTHAWLNALAKDIRAILIDVADSDGRLDTMGLYRARVGIDAAWADHFTAWQREFYALYEEAAAIPLGALAVLHESWARTDLAEAGAIDDILAQIKQLVSAQARGRIYADGIPLSTRIWKLGHESLAGIQQGLYAGYSSGNSARNIAKTLEGFLGGGRNCPRWTSTRLRLTKKEIASGNRAGLISGDACRGQGVAYNALRLARNEYAVVHARMTDELMRSMPWIAEEQINLSPSHPQTDVCDNIVSGGREGKGIYPVGTIQLPIHVQCLCFKTAVQVSRDDFTKRLRSWVGGGPDVALDKYNTMIGGDATISLLQAQLSLGILRWAFGSPSAMRSTLP